MDTIVTATDRDTNSADNGNGAAAAGEVTVRIAFRFQMGGPQQRDERTQLHLSKIQKLIESMSPCTLEEIGSIAWLKKVNALAIIVNQRSMMEMVRDLGTFLEYLLKHNKLTVLVHDLVLLTVWRDEILPKLMEISEEGTVAGKEARISESTVKALLYQVYECSLVLAAVAQLPDMLTYFGPDIFNLIDYAVGEFRYFIASKPDHDPALDNDDTPDFDTIENIPVRGLTYEQHCIYACHSMAFLNILAQRNAVQRLPEDILIKLIHPDTRLVITLVDMILTRPWCYSKEKHGYVKFMTSNPNSEGRNRNRRGKIALHPFEAGCFSLLLAIFVFDDFPSALQMTQECHDKLLQLRVLRKSQRLWNKMPSMGRLMTFLDRLASAPHKSLPPETWAPVPPSSYYVSIRADLEQKKDAIIRIHSAMGTFEEKGMADMYRRFVRDNSYLASTCDMIKCCFKCAKGDAELRCSRCRYAYYCNKKCQSRDWSKHKLVCSPF